MREILFRGKTPSGEWVKGDYVTDVFTKKPFINTSRNGYEKVVSETVGQYTGLTDKNGTKIFEGDIVKARLKPLPTFPNCYAVGKVVFENGTFKILVYKSSNKKKYKDYTGENIRAYPIENNFIDRGYLLEIIGNIHDNPELLGGADNG